MNDTDRNDLYGYVVEFDDVDALLDGARTMRDAGYTRWDCHSPFVVHGLDGAMGIRQTKLPWVVFFAGAFGCVAGIGLQWWTNAFDYPFMISGKPFFSLPARRTSRWRSRPPSCSRRSRRSSACSRSTTCRSCTTRCTGAG